MKALLALAVFVTAAPALPVPTEAEPAAGPQAAPRLCVLIHQERGGSRRMCLTTAEWRTRLGPDWRQRLSGRTLDDDLALLATLTRQRSDPAIRDCRVCREITPPRQD